mmetsp:Transcript_25230/g.39855  ORF Transcript_25230/g.39855 Transcript_25230/m.39855 type:complete len:80 (-) Transcript_25230:54-293(-)
MQPTENQWYKRSPRNILPSTTQNLNPHTNPPQSHSLLRDKPFELLNSSIVQSVKPVKSSIPPTTLKARYTNRLTGSLEK